MSAAHASGALARLGSLAAAGSPPDDVALKAEVIAAGWWWNAHGDLGPERLVLLVQELGAGVPLPPGVTRCVGIA